MELLEKIINLTKELNIPTRDNSGIRNWSTSIGINPKDNPEEFIKRVIIACSQQFNFREENIPKLSAESIMKWIRNGYFKHKLSKLNLRYIRYNLYDKCKSFIYFCQIQWGEKSLLVAIQSNKFWKYLPEVYNNDPVNKRVALARMMLKDSGFKIYNYNKPNIAIDYNILAVLKYLGIIEYKGDFKDTRVEVNRIRKKAYKIIKDLIVKNIKRDTYIDGLMFFLGRELRKRKLVNVCLYKGCTDY